MFISHNFSYSIFFNSKSEKKNETHKLILMTSNWLIWKIQKWLKNSLKLQRPK
jgi:hypothetical protein